MTSPVLSVTTDAATVEVDAGIAIAAGGCTGKCKAELLAVRGKHGVLALGTGRDRGNRFSRNSLFSLTIRREVTRGATTKTASASVLAGLLG